MMPQEQVISSNRDSMFLIPSIKQCQLLWLRQYTFYVAVPTLWNRLPLKIQIALTQLKFHKILKTWQYSSISPEYWVSPRKCGVILICISIANLFYFSFFNDCFCLYTAQNCYRLSGHPSGMNEINILRKLIKLY